MLGANSDRATVVEAILLISLSVVLFAIMDGLAKFLTGQYSVVQVVWARYAFAVPVVLATTPLAGWPNLLRCDRPALQAGRSFLPVMANVTAMTGVSLMPLADATAISFLSPLLVVALSVPLLGERVSAQGWLGVACGFVGTLVIIRPGAGTLAWVAAFPLATAVIFALYQVLTRLVSRADKPAVTLAWTIVVGLVVFTVLLPAFWHPVPAGDWPLLVLSGLLFGGGHALMTRAFTAAPASVLAPFTYLQIVAAAVFGLIVFGDMPDVWTIAGTGLVVLAGIYVLGHRPARRRRSSVQPVA